jgi:hypothetical protein
MRRVDRILCVGALVVTGVVTPVVAAEAEAAKAQQPKTPSSAVAALGLLHHVAEHEIALGLLAQVAAVRPETMRFADELETSFRALERRIVASADAQAIGEDRLRQAYAAENTSALDGQTQDLDRLSMVRGKDFDRQFWVTVSRDHRAASALLAAAAGAIPSLDPLIAETVRLLDRSARQARAAQTNENK